MGASFRRPAACRCWHRDDTMPMEGSFKWHQYQVVGRHLPSDDNPAPTPYRMKLWATDAVRAKSKFWYFLGKQHKVKKAHGEIIACNEIFEKKPTTIKNFGIWLRYQSRTGVHNMYKEYREVTLNDAVNHMYHEMASRHLSACPTSRSSRLQWFLPLSAS